MGKIVDGVKGIYDKQIIEKNNQVMNLQADRNKICVEMNEIESELNKTHDARSELAIDQDKTELNNIIENLNDKLIKLQNEKLKIVESMRRLEEKIAEDIQHRKEVLTGKE